MAIHSEDDYMEIPYQSFWDIGTYLVNRFNEPRANMDLVLRELVALHGCKKENDEKCENIDVCRCDVGSDKTVLHERKKIVSIDSEIFSLCSDDTDNTIFKYYISDDEINIYPE
jgi:hypothetical protein